MTGRTAAIAAVIVGAMTGLLCRSPEMRADASAAPSIQGVWTFVSETNTENGQVLHSDKDLTAIWIFSKRYYCLARMEFHRTAKARADLDAMKPEEQVKYYEQLLRYSSTAGTYSLSDGNLTRTWDISLTPDIIGQKQVARVSVDAEHLTVDLPRRNASSGPASRVIYRRLE